MLELPLWLGGLILTLIGILSFWAGNKFDEYGTTGILAIIGGLMMGIIGIMILVMSIGSMVTWT